MPDPSRIAEIGEPWMNISIVSPDRHIGAIMELVRAGLGVAVLARWAVQPRVTAGALRALGFTREGDRRQWSAAVLKDMAGTAYVTEFIDLVARHPPIATRWRTTPRPPAHSLDARKGYQQAAPNDFVKRISIARRPLARSARVPVPVK